VPVRVAWNQGEDLFGYADNRLLPAQNMVAMCNLSYPFHPSLTHSMYNCSDAGNATLSINGLGGWIAVWELIYNHTWSGVVCADSLLPKAHAQLMRPDQWQR